MGNGNDESLRRTISPQDSIIGWHFTSFASKRSRIRVWAEDLAGPAVLVLRSPQATRTFLAGLRSPSGSPR